MLQICYKKPSNSVKICLSRKDKKDLFSKPPLLLKTLSLNTVNITSLNQSLCWTKFTAYLVSKNLNFNYSNMENILHCTGNSLVTVIIKPSWLDKIVCWFVHGWHFHQSNPLSFQPTDLRIQRVFSRNASDFHIKGSEKRNFINIPSSNFQDNGLCKYIFGQQILANFSYEIKAICINSYLYTICKQCGWISGSNGIQ